MKIKKLKIKNFKSFGNNENELVFSENGELILLVGKNGHGKSSIIDSIDFALYNKVKGKKAKTVPLSNLPNRFNKNLYVELEFESYNENINIIRTINPNSLILTENGQINDKAGKSYKQEIIENKIGLDFDTFKSFISMSINDFKNFMTLTPEEKRVLLDRLFNLEMINNISKILKKIQNEHKEQMDLFETEINAYQTSLLEFNNSIEKIKEAKEKNLNAEKEEIKNLITLKKDDFLLLKEKINKCDEKDEYLKEKYQTNQISLTETSFKIKDYNSKIKLYDSGKCPTCNTKLTDDIHNAYRSELKQTVEQLIETYKELKKEQTDYLNKSNKLSKIKKDTESMFFELKSYLNNLKNRLNELKDNNNDEDSNIEQLMESISNIETKKSESNSKYVNVKNKNLVTTQLSKLFSNDGIKKSIISKIVKPINFFIKDFLDELNMNFYVELDDDFSAKIYNLGEEIHVETLSTGETKKVNIAIMLAYLKLIRLKKYINVLFLDEVFASIDIEGIYDILKLLKNFAKDYKINIFLIHHAMLDRNLFDKILKIEKNITSNIIEDIS